MSVKLETSCRHSDSLPWMFCDLTKILIALPATLSQNSYYESKPPIQGGRIGNLKVNNDLVFSAPNQCLGRLQLGHCTNWIQAHFFKWAVPGFFFFIFVFSIQLTINVQYKFFLMTGFEPRTSGIGSDRFTDWATTTAPQAHLFTDRFSFYGSMTLLNNGISSVFTQIKWGMRTVKVHY